MGMQEALFMAEQWSMQVGLNLNVKKCEAVRPFKKRDVGNMGVLKLEGTPLFVVQTMKYLCVYLQCDLQWNFHLGYATKKVNDRVKLVQAVVGKFWELNPSILYAIMRGALSQFCIT